MIITLNPSDVKSYRQFLQIKRLPQYRIQGRQAWFPDEYADRICRGSNAKRRKASYKPPDWMFDYQAAITEMAIRKHKYAVFADCGLGKTAIILEVARVASHDGKVLIVSPLNVIAQTMSEAAKFYSGELQIQQIRAADLQQWLDAGDGIGIVNYEAMNIDIRGHLAGLILDESSMLKSHYGKWAAAVLKLGRGVKWKLCCTGTPAPNDRIEYANHAVFLDHFPTVNSFLATFFVNRGQTDNRWELKPHALKPFYRALSHWCIFLTDPRTYGWHDNTSNIPPIRTRIHDVPLTDEQRDLVRQEIGQLFATKSGGIVGRSDMGQIGKGFFRGRKIASNKPAFIKSLIESWPEESTITWCLYNEEQRELQKVFPDAGSITGSTKYEKRIELIEQFQRGELKHLISKPKILGFGLNLQKATRQVFSGLQDSYESYYQAVKRSNRYGSTRPLHVHIPVTEVEEPMVQNVLRKADRVQADTEEQEQIFKQFAWG